MVGARTLPPPSVQHSRHTEMDLGGTKRWEEYMDSLGPDAPSIKIKKPAE